MEEKIESLLCKCSPGLWHKLLYLGIVLECDAPVLEAFYHWHSSFLCWKGTMRSALSLALVDNMYTFFNKSHYWHITSHARGIIKFVHHFHQISVEQDDSLLTPNTTQVPLLIIRYRNYNSLVGPWAWRETMRCSVFVRTDCDNRLFIQRMWGNFILETSVRTGDLEATLDANLQAMMPP
jgi:hypothetical protein